MSSALPASRAAALTAGLPDAFLAHGLDPAGDVDVAFDDATQQAGYDHGFAGLTASIASIEASSVIVTQTSPVTLARGCLLAVAALEAGAHEGGELERGVAYALPICPDSAYRRRRVRMTLTDPGQVISESSGSLRHVTAPLEQLLRDAAAAAGTPLTAEEVFEAVEVTTARHRFKPVVVTHPGPTAAEYVVLDPATNTVVSTEHRTAGEARRAAVELAKAGPISGDPTGLLDVVKLSRRAGGHPFARVTRTRLATRQVVKVTAAAEKDPAKTRTTGWLFYGTSPHSPA